MSISRIFIAESIALTNFLENKRTNMKISTLKLLVPIVAITVQSNSASTIIPPFLHDLHIPMAAIGTLISLGPILALTSRLPVGMAYQRTRARLLVSIGVLAMGITNYLYGFAQDILVFAIVHALNGFAYGAVTTLYMAFYVDSLARMKTATMPWVIMSVPWPWGTPREISSADCWQIILVTDLHFRSRRFCRSCRWRSYGFCTGQAAKEAAVRTRSRRQNSR